MAAILCKYMDVPRNEASIKDTNGRLEKALVLGGVDERPDRTNSHAPLPDWQVEWSVYSRRVRRSICHIVHHLRLFLL